MATLNEMCDAVAATIRDHTGLRAVELSDSPPVPCALVHPAEDIGADGSYYRTFKRGVLEVDIIAHVLVAAANSTRSAQRALNEYLSPDGPKSIPQAIHEHPTLGTDPAESVSGTPTMTAHVSGISEYGLVTAVDGTRLLGAKVQIHVACRGDR